MREAHITYNKQKKVITIDQRGSKGELGARHHASYLYLAYHCSPDRTAHELGYRDTTMLYLYYRELVTQEEAQKFWSIKPEFRSYVWGDPAMRCLLHITSLEKMTQKTL